MLAQSSYPARGLSAELLRAMVGKVLGALSQQEKKTNNFPEAERKQKKGKNNVIKQISHSALMVFRQACVCFSTSVVRCWVQFWKISVSVSLLARLLF